MRVYSVSGDSLNEKTTIELSGEISAAAYSPEGEFLAVTSGRSVCTYDSASYQVSLFRYVAELLLRDHGMTISISTYTNLVLLYTH